MNEQTLNINVPEKIGFVEVFSEQELRLLFLAVEAPPDGPVEQPAVVELSEGRRLELTVSFQVPWPQVRVVYVDPTISALLEALPQAPSKSPAAQKKQAPAKEEPKAEEQKPAEEPPPSNGLFRTKVKITGSQASTDKTRAASAGFNGVEPSGKVATALLNAAPTAQNKQAALILSTLVMPQSEVDKFIAEGKLSPPPPPAPAKGGK